MRLLMVCLGNICRSPIAEGVMRHKAKQLGLDWVIESAGTESYHVGEPPHRWSQAICLANGIDISHQRARRFTAGDFSAYDKIFAMADDVYREIRQIGVRGGVPDMSAVDYFLNELHRSPVPGVSTAMNESVPDPYFGPAEGFRVVYDMIDQTCDAIIRNYSRP